MSYTSLFLLHFHFKKIKIKETNTTRLLSGESYYNIYEQRYGNHDKLFVVIDRHILQSISILN